MILFEENCACIGARAPARAFYYNIYGCAIRQLLRKPLHIIIGAHFSYIKFAFLRSRAKEY